MDAILALDDQGRPYEPQWPEADVIIGNPPFLGGSLISGELGRDYYERLTALYKGRVPGFSDLVCYWFERARARIERGAARRAGLLATNSIRGGANRRALERIKESGDIFMAWGDRPWVLKGAAVRVSMVGFDGGAEPGRALDGRPVASINPDLTSSADLTSARRLRENRGIAFIGTKKGGPFDITEQRAREFLGRAGNPNGRPNSDVVKPWINGQALVGRPSANTWIIDFGVGASEEEASRYEAPFEYAKLHVYPVRARNNRASRRERWWLHSETAPALRSAISGLSRYIATPGTSKYRIFAWAPSATLPDNGVFALAREDDYFFGVLHSRPHELWSLRMGTELEDRPRYTPSTTFETFPLPWAPGREPQGDPRVESIAAAARELVEARGNALGAEAPQEGAKKRRTLTDLYNERPTWLRHAHRKLDRAVLDAYGWEHDLSDEQLLERLLALNLERAGSTPDLAPGLEPAGTP